MIKIAPYHAERTWLCNNGNGRRVKSTINGTTTYFIGAHYEVTDGVVTKYYYAGAQRIAMRSSGTLYFMVSTGSTQRLGDHLGSTSLMTFANGNVVSETRYKAWGEVRYSSAYAPTNYTYTGQYSNMDDFGLMFYNARWYDPALGRFAQADSIIPSGVQGLDRYAYTRNNPMKYIDASGHQEACAYLGECPDYTGIDKAEEIMAMVTRGNRDILVAAGIAVQSQWPDQPIHTQTSGQGPAQLSEAQLNTNYGDPVPGSGQYGLGLWGADPEDEITAVYGMSRRIYQVLNQCSFCTVQDKVIVAALAQNNGFTLSTV